MVIEIAIIELRENTFEKFFEKLKIAINFLEKTPGYLSIKVHREIENKNLIYLFIQWETLDSHLVNFRQSQNFTEWRNLLGEFFLTDPRVQHVEEISGLAG